MIGKQISHYKIIEQIGEGGMGVVYKAEDSKLKRTVALKFLPPNLSIDFEAKSRFIHEAQAASALDHTNICTIYEIDETDDGQLFMAMPCYDGKILKEKIDQGPLSLVEASSIIFQIARGLAKAHEKSIIHRDIKPANIMITDDGVVKILDFGLAKLSGQTMLTKEGSTLGTVAYMSTEQTRGEEVTNRTDIWSLGVALYEMITGQSPFKGDYEQAVMYSIVNEDPEPPTALRTGVPMELERIINKTLEKKPGERYQHVDDLLVDLGSLIKELESGETKSKQDMKKFPKKRIPIYGGLSVILILIVVTIYSLIFAPGKAIDSIAVLPFSNTADDPDLEYLSDGMTESIINSLSKLPSLKKVIARSSVFYYKGKDIVPAEVGKELGVESLLISRISQYGDELTISVELVNTETNNRIWGSQYKRSFSEIFKIQDEISKAITENLRLELTGEDYIRMRKRYTEDSEAYQFYLKGKYFFYKQTEDGLNKSIDFFQKALQEDPDFALAHAGISDSYNFLGLYHFIPAEIARQKGVASALKALEIDDTIGEAHVALANHKLYFEWKLDEAENEYKKALLHNPLDADAYHQYAHLLGYIGRHKESTQMMSQAVELEPLSTFTSSCFGQILYRARRYDEAIVQLKKTIEMDTTFNDPYGWLGMAYLKKGMYKQAIEQFQKGLTFPTYKTRMIGALGYTYAILGRKEEALQNLDRLNNLSKEMNVDPYYISWIYAGLGEKDKAFEWLEKAYEEKSSSLIKLRMDQFFGNLSSDPRFTPLIKRIGLKKD